MLTPMKHRISLLLATTATALVVGACAGQPEKKPAGPATETSRMPWNTPVPGQGQGQFGMMPQNQYRR